MVPVEGDVGGFVSTFNFVAEPVFVGPAGFVVAVDFDATVDFGAAAFVTAGSVLVDFVASVATVAAANPAPTVSTGDSELAWVVE